MINEFYSCPAACTDVTLPALPEDPYCVQVPQLSQIGGLVIVPCGVDDPFVDNAGTIELGDSAIDNTAADNSAPHLLIGKGGIEDHEALTYEAPLRRNVNWLRRYTMTFEVSVAQQEVYEYLQALQCGSINFRFFYIDMAGYLYGKVTADADGGIIPMMVNVQMPKGSGQDDLQVGTISVTWESSTGDPNRYASPIDLLASSCEAAPAV